MDFDISASDYDGRTIISVSGELDAYAAARFHPACVNVLASPASRVIVDLPGCHFSIRPALVCS